MTRPLAGPQTLLRTLNGRAILEALARSGPRTRAELMSATGLSRTAVTQVLRMLETAGAVVPAGVDRDTRGPAAGRVSLHPHLGYAAAIHVDHHAAHVVLVDATGSVRAEAHGDFRTNDDRVACIAGLVDECRRAAKGPLHMAVVAVPGAVTPDGGIRNDEGPDGGQFHTALSATLGCDVRIENDVNLAALAELTESTAGSLSSFALLLLVEDGLGAGIVIDGALHRGASGLAGEVMYLPQSPLPIGAPVVSDVVVSDLALTHDRDPRAALSVHLEAAAAGDEAALQIVAEVARRLVLIAGTMTLVLDPEAFILSGDAAHPVLAEAMVRVAEEFAPLLTVRFLIASFGVEAPLVGAVREAASALRAMLFTRVLAT
ncbi:N-acetylglucosamine repressor [Microbacterium oxydans]|uniref:N-acetylglucosamine repressor n=1 Tax=Microbacterium oxydans TaxID=82380 RepID=A0A0F0LJ76_9MICO|nr:ROK family transcriptional regulator [Microbacterium oxydans]KJL31606.1 N-acetylglucosamine repressor [Microbacterium oxydans]CAH0251305.1 N-acetylglucosamine repressor [Microbacterium oxydans]